MERINSRKIYLFASDFDQTLSFNDSGFILSELLGVAGFERKVAELARKNLVQQGGELAYLLLQDPAFRHVRKEHLHEAGQRIRVKRNIDLLAKLLNQGIEGYQFLFYVISAAPEEVIQSALADVIPPERIIGTKFEYNPETGEIQSILRVPAGYGKVAVLNELQSQVQVSSDRIVYVGDGSSDVHVMLHVNHRYGFTIAVSENKYLVPIAKRVILSDDALSVLIPILEDLVGWNDSLQIRAFFESFGLQIQEWDKVRTDLLTIRDLPMGVETELPLVLEAGHG
ncbi:MAG TPA: haloacid dehalogenase-like hydrolase [Blastocatellia bacterium]|nr:haloacid dehalogenase-like hydrolase [Blastocatellia bacterium]